jgi:hypothetical protein
VFVVDLWMPECRAGGLQQPSGKAPTSGRDDVTSCNAAQTAYRPVQPSAIQEPLTGAAALAAFQLTPGQALQAGALNARVCKGWPGLRFYPSMSSAIAWFCCMPSSASRLSVMAREAALKACGAGPYDRQLLQPFTLVWVSAKVTGQAEFVGTQIPVIEIDALYRSSDCLQGDTAPQCVHSYLQPQKKPQ